MHGCLEVNWGGYAGGGKARIKRACIGLTRLVLEWQECQAFKFKGRREHSQKLNNHHNHHSHQSEDIAELPKWWLSVHCTVQRGWLFHFKPLRVAKVEQARLCMNLNLWCEPLFVCFYRWRELFAFTDGERGRIERGRRRHC